MTDRIWTPVVMAWINPGGHPEYHEMIKDKLKVMWPTLYYALESSITTLEKEGRNLGSDKMGIGET